MNAQTLRDRYVGDSIATASPSRLLVMLYDRLLLDLDNAGRLVQCAIDLFSFAIIGLGSKSPETENVKLAGKKYFS